MELATETKAFPAYSPTSTPILDVLRPAPHGRPGRLAAGEYFFLSSLLILILTGLSEIREASATASSPAQLAGTLLATPALGLLAAWLVHEAGHGIAGWISGFRVQRVQFGAGRSFARLNACESIRVGTLLLESRKTLNLRRRLLIMFLGGPIAGLLFALGLEFCRDWPQAGTLVQFRVHVVSALSMLVSLASLLPDTSRRGSFSDGARLVMLFKNDANALRLFAILEMQGALRNGIHPREWNDAVIANATYGNDESRDSVTAHWLAYLWATERQDITSATRYLEDALAAPAACSAWLRDRLYLEAAAFQAWFRDNPAKARCWAVLIREERLTACERQRLAVLMLWAEGKLFDAFEKMGGYFTALGELPESPARDLAQKSATEWKHQMESRMLTRAWRAMYTLSQQVDSSSAKDKISAATGSEVSSC